MYTHNKPMKTFYRFIIYGLVGIWLEIFWTGLESLLQQNYTLRGTTYIWMILIYGLGVFLEPLQNILKKTNVLIRGSLYTILIFFAEYLTGFLLKLLLGSCPWNYTDIYSIHGLITLSFIPVWFIVGLLFEKIHYTLDIITIDINKDVVSKKTLYQISRKKQL